MAENVEALAQRDRGGLVRARVVDQQGAVRGLHRDGGGHERDRARGVVGGQHDVDLLIAAAVGDTRLGRSDRLDAMCQHHALVSERHRDGRPPKPAAAQPPDGARRTPPTALRQAPNPVAKREGTHQRHVLRDDQPAGTQQLAQRGARQQIGVRGQVAPPAAPRQPRGARRRIRRDHAEHPAGSEQSLAVVDCGHGIVEMLDHVGQDDDREALVVGELVERLLAHVEAEHLAPVGGGARRQLQPHHVVAAPPRLVEQQPVPAAHVEQTPRRHVAADQVEQAARGGPPAGLLIEVGLVLHAPVELVQVGPLRQRGLVHGAAMTADEQVAVLTWTVVGGREMLGLGGRSRAPEAQNQRPRADPTVGRDAHELRQLNQVVALKLAT